MAVDSASMASLGPVYIGSRWIWAMARLSSSELYTSSGFMYPVLSSSREHCSGVLDRLPLVAREVPGGWVNAFMWMVVRSSLLPFLAVHVGQN